MIKVKVPATSANCAVGFDCLGLALDWMAEFCFETSDSLVIEGCPEEYCNENNLTVQAFYEFCDAFNLERPVFKITTSTEIPFARGLGSSATCIIGGLLAARAWFEHPASDDEILQLASMMEGHPDNVGPALYGSLCAGMPVDHQGIRRYVLRKIESEGWHALAMVPDYEISTEEARKALPESLSFKDAVLQCQRALMFEKAWVDQDEPLLAQCAVDLFHEKVRLKSWPQEMEWINSIREKGIPCWLSGSGSTFLCVSRNKKWLEALERDMEKFNLKTRLMSVCEEGASVQYV